MLTSQLEIINQGISYLDSVTTNDYNIVVAPQFASSAGAHMRHIIDHYQALITGEHNGLINYDLRQRGQDIEFNIQLAKQALKKIATWISELSNERLEKSIILSSEISVQRKKVMKLKTTLSRELLFVASHAVHHYAMIAQIAKAQTLTLPNQFGIAPATATFIRETNNNSSEN